MLILTGTNDIIRITTTSTSALDVQASYVDLSGTTPTPGRTNTAISSIATSTVVAAPGSSIYRNVKLLHVINVGAASNTVTVEVYDGSTAITLVKTTLDPNEELRIDENGTPTVSLASVPICTGIGLTTSGVLMSPHFQTANLTTAKTITSGSSFAVFIGYAPRPLTSLTYRARVTTAVATITWAETALAVGTPKPGVNQYLNIVGYGDISATYNSLGLKTTTTNVSTGQAINTGDGIWVIFGCQATTALQLRAASIADDLQAGLQASSGTRPSTAVGTPLTWTIEGATATSAWVAALL